MIQTLASSVSNTFVNIFQYLHYTLGYVLRSVPIPPQSKHGLWVLGDASFAPTGEKSQQGLIAYHVITSNQKKGGNLVQWRSGRQDLIAKSACEAELIAPSEVLQQGENIAIVVAEMTNQSCEIEVSSDNAASLHMIRNGSETAWRTRHISVKALWLHQMARRGITSQPQKLQQIVWPKAWEPAEVRRFERTFVWLKTSMLWSCSKWFPSTPSALFCECVAYISNNSQVSPSHIKSVWSYVRLRVRLPMYIRIHERLEGRHDF